MDFGKLGTYAIKVLIKLLHLDFTVEEVFSQVISSAETMLVVLLAAGIVFTLLAWTESQLIQCVQGFVCGLLISRVLGVFLVLAGIISGDEQWFVDILFGCTIALIGLLTKHIGAVINILLLSTYAGVLMQSDSLDVITRMMLGFLFGILVSVLATVILDVNKFATYVLLSAAEIMLVVHHRVGSNVVSNLVFATAVSVGIAIYIVTHNNQWLNKAEKLEVREKIEADNKLQVLREQNYKKERVIKNKKKLVIYSASIAVLAGLCWYVPKNDTVMYNYCMVKAKLVRDSEKEQTYEKAKQYKNWFGAYRELARLYSVKGNMIALKAELEEINEEFGSTDRKTMTLTEELTVPVPTFSVDGGNYKTGQVVELIENSNGDSVVYTIEKKGTSIEESGKIKYSEPITLDKDGTYKITARSVTRKGYTSEVVSNTYTLDLNFPGMVTATVEGGDYTQGFNVELLSEEGYVLYTTDGTEPTNTSKLYKRPINIGMGITTVKSMSVNRLGKNSDVSTEVYRVSYDDSASTSDDSGGYSGYYYDYVVSEDKLGMPIISVRTKNSNKEVKRLSGKNPNEHGLTLYYLDSSGYVGEMNLEDLSVTLEKDFEAEKIIVEHGGIYYSDMGSGQLRFYDLETGSTTTISDEYTKLMSRCNGMLYYITTEGLYRVEEKLSIPVLLIECGERVREKKTLGSLVDTTSETETVTEEQQTSKSTSELLEEQIVQREKQYEITDVYTADNNNVYYIEDGDLYLLDMTSLTYRKVINSEIQSSSNGASGYQINEDGSVIFFDTDGILKTWRDNGVVAYIDSLTGEEIRTYNNGEMPWTAEQREDRITQYNKLRALKSDAVRKRKVNLTGLNAVRQNEDGSYTLANGLKATTNPDGSMDLSDGSKVYSNGNIILSDGTVISPDGSKVFKDGTSVAPSGIVTYKNGDVVYADNSIRYSNGISVDTFGNITYPNGNKVNKYNTLTYPDGSTLDVNGKRTAKDGEVTYEGPRNSELNNGTFDKSEKICLGITGSNGTIAVKINERTENYSIDSLSDSLIGWDTAESMKWSLIDSEGNLTDLLENKEQLFFTDYGYYTDNMEYKTYKH